MQNDYFALGSNLLSRQSPHCPLTGELPTGRCSCLSGPAKWGLPSTRAHLAQLPKEFIPTPHQAGATLPSSYLLGTDSPTTHSQALIFYAIITVALGTQSETSHKIASTGLMTFHWAHVSRSTRENVTSLSIAPSFSVSAL